MLTPVIKRIAMRQALEAALDACSGILPAKGGAFVEPPEPTFVVSDRLTEALELAIAQHRNQVRKGTSIPYLTHLLAVAAMVGEAGGSEDEMIAALLHDTVEDGGGPAMLGGILERFGPLVAEIVKGCSDEITQDEKLPWLERKQRYLGHLPEAPLHVLRVVCADKLHNAQSLARDLKAQGPSVFERFKADREGTLWYYRSFARFFGALLQDEPTLDNGFRAIIRELRETIASLEG